MIAERSSTRRAFDESIRLLLSLHAMTMAGREESREADDVRDGMETPWHSMTVEERGMIRGLSADLYSIGSTRIMTGEGPPPDFTKELQGLTANDAWHGILDLLRKEELRLSPRDVAYARGLCWAHLGQPNVAIEFLNEAARLRALTAAEEILLLTCYVQGRRAHDVMGRAQAIREATQDPLLLLKAAEVFTIAADDSEANVIVEYRRAAIDCAERAFALLGAIEIAAENRNVLNSFVVPAYLHLSINYDELGDRARALEACRNALRIAPENPDGLMLYGHLNFQPLQAAGRTSFSGRFHDRLPPIEQPIFQLN